MLAGQPINILNLLKAAVAGTMLFLLHACSVYPVPKNYPPNVPFVYEYNINVEGNLSEEEKANLESALQRQLDDSIGVRTTRKFFYRFTFNRPILNNPPVYRDEYAAKSVSFMKALMVSQGYFYDTISYETKIDTVIEKNEQAQYRTTVNFNVKTGRLMRLDSIVYNISYPELQQLAEQNMNTTLVKKDGAFAKSVIGAELDRLVEIFRNNGYLGFTRDELVVVWDTLDVALLRPSLDPFAQMELLQKLRERRNNPTANIEIRLRPGLDSARLVKYYIGKVSIYPDYGADTSNLERKEKYIDPGTRVVQFRNKFKPKIFKGNVYLRYGELYRLRRYQRTINRLNSIGAWRLINIQTHRRPGQDTVDISILLTPSDKYLFSANAEATQNQTVIAGNLFGVGLNTGVQNRNFARAANQASTNIRFGIELGDSSFVQTRQFSFGHKIYFPRPVPNLPLIKESDRDNIRTVLTFNAANTERNNLYNLNTFNASLGYEFQRNVPQTNKTRFFSARLLNIEYSSLTRRQGLEDLIANNPALANLFSDGFVSSIILGLTNAGGHERRPAVFNANLEYSPWLAGLIKSKFLDEQLYRFVKVNAEYTRLLKFGKASALSLRAFGGLGYALNSTVDDDKRTKLPFFKQYFAGGPNSMRAWQLRRLGPGSTVKDFRGPNSTPDRFGDIQLEFNIEYRFPVAVVAGTKLEGALFTDIGNVWLMKEGAGDPDEVFQFSRLGKDLAVGVGAGLRVDFSFFIIRLDYAYKAKDPSPSVDDLSLQNKWFGYKLSKGDQFQLGINYPFKL